MSLKVIDSNLQKEIYSIGLERQLYPDIERELLPEQEHQFGLGSEQQLELQHKIQKRNV